jgi:hypothetical protein
MKLIHLAVACLILYKPGKAQDIFSNRVNIALEKVLKDFPNRFHNIKGEIIGQNPQATEYRSVIQVPGPGTASCTVTRYVVNKKDVYTWTYVAFRTEDFLLAKSKFKEIFGQVENTIVKIDGEKPFIINGQYETPSERRKSNNILFELLPAMGDIKNIKVELALQYEGKDWKVSLNVADNDQKSEGQGAMTEN